MPQKKRRAGAGKPKRPAKAAPTKAVSGKAAQPKAAPAMSRAMRARVRRQRAIRLGAIAIAVLVVSALVWRFVSNRQAEAEVRAELEAAGCTVDTRSDSDRGAGRNHREGVRYQIDPPAGGDHSPSPMPPGRYSADEAPDDRVVHSMEHGYVVIWHRADLASEDLDAIIELQGEYDRDALLVERPAMTVPVAVTAWHRRALCRDVTSEALASFITEYRNKGPEKVEH